MAKTPADIRSLARSHTKTAINTLAGIMEQSDAPPAARVMAAKELMDRGWGKAVQYSEILHKTVIQLTDDELANIATGSGDGDNPPPVNPSQLN